VLLLLVELKLTLLLELKSLLLRHDHVHSRLHWANDADGRVRLAILRHLHRDPRRTRLSGLLHEVRLRMRHGR
jgi:hypothetical protein